MNIRILICSVLAGCNANPSGPDGVDPSPAKAEAQRLSAEAKARYCAQPYSIRLGAHQAAVTAAAAAAGNPALAAVPYIDLCQE